MQLEQRNNTKTLTLCCCNKYHTKYHTLAGQCQSVIRSTLKVSGKAWNSTPPVTENACTDSYQNWQGWLCSGYLPCAKLHYDPIWGFWTPHMRSSLRNVHSAIVSGFFQLATPLAAAPILSINIRWKTSFRARVCLLSVPKMKSYIWPHFPKNGNFRSILTGLIKFRLKTGFNMGTSPGTPKTTS